MKNPKLLAPLVAIAALMLLAVPAQAKPSPKNARHAAGKARTAVAAAVDAAQTGDVTGAADRIAAAGKLQAKAVRIARRAGSGRKVATKAKLLRGAAASVDEAFGSYAELIAQAPPELQPYLLEALESLEALRAQLLAELTGYLETLPEDVRNQILAAITAFQDDGDLQALIEALSGGELAAAVQTGLQGLVAQLTATMGEHLGELGNLEELLPPGALEQLQAAMGQLQTQLEEALAQLSEILGEGGLPTGGGGSLPPEGLPGNVCEQLEGLLGGFGFPVPSGFCEG